ncbi:MAG: YggS family pyridoxal phosphate enzyme [Solirubrobacterales bacterium]
MASRQFTGLDPERLRRRLADVRERAGEGVEVLVACKYVPVEEMGALAEAGVELVGENRLGDLEAKRERWGDAFTWDFIGHVQSRKLKTILPRVRLIHSVCTESVLGELGKHGTPDSEVLVQVDLASEDSKSGIPPDRLGEVIEECPVKVVGLSTMPPAVERAEQSRRWFARLAELAADHELERLSMGTSQDWEVAVEEGATTIRIGSTLFE